MYNILIEQYESSYYVYVISWKSSNIRIHRTYENQALLNFAVKLAFSSQNSF